MRSRCSPPCCSSPPSGCRALSLALRPPGAALALAPRAALRKEARGVARRVARPDAGGSARHGRAGTGPQRRRLVAGASRDLLRGPLRLVPLAAALAALDPARSLLGVLPAERAGRAHRGLSDELAGRDVLLQEHRPAGGPGGAVRLATGLRGRPRPAQVDPGGAGSRRRSEEHTSELQSQFHLVCRLLLEKKKKKINTPVHQKKNAMQKKNK